MLETAIVIVVVVVAAALIFRSLYRTVNGDGESCACTSSCNSDCKHCPAVDQAKKLVESIEPKSKS